MKVWILWLAVGGVLVAGAARFLEKLSAPEIALRLAPTGPEGKTALPLRFTNHGNREIRLDAGTMELFVYAPEDGSNRFLLQAQSTGGTSIGEIVVKPGESADVGDAYPLVHKLPKGRLRSVYAAAGDGADNVFSSWRGVVHAPVLSLTE